MHGKTYVITGGAFGVIASTAWFFMLPDPEVVTPSGCQVFPVSNQSDSPEETMVWIESGSFVMGSDTGYPEEGPTRTEKIEGFWIDRHEVTNAEFKTFVDATGYITTAEKTPDLADYPDVDEKYRKPGAAVFSPPESVVSGWWQYVVGANWRHPEGPTSSIEGKEQYPVVQVSYEDATAYANWIGKELPTEAQWEYAASREATLMSPQSDMTQPLEANTWQGLFPVRDSGKDGFAGLAPVGCYKASENGLHDMLGNVWEWTNGRYAYADTNITIAQRVLKGGSFLCAPNFCQRYRPEARQGQDENFSTNHIGFRLVLNEQAPLLSSQP